MTLRLISEVRQLPVLDLETGTILGEVVSWAIHPQTGKVLSYILEKPTLWKKARIIVPPDIIEYGPKMIVVRNGDSVITPDEIVGLPEQLEAPILIVGYQAETETGKILGKVTDFVFEIIGSVIQQYYVRPSTKLGAWQEDFILPANKVIRIENNRLVFPDDILTTATLVTTAQTQTA